MLGWGERAFVECCVFLLRAFLASFVEASRSRGTFRHFHDSAAVRHARL